jgi:hypothetical protein
MNSFNKAVDLTQKVNRHFYEKLEVSLNGCWLWKGGLNKGGYGRFRAGTRTIPAHRYSYTLFKGEIPEGLHLDHLCRVHNCVNPDHLEPVTPKENVFRGNSFAAINATKEHCPKGHPYDESNTLLCQRPNKDIKRRCKACQSLYMKEYKARQVTIQ